MDIQVKNSIEDYLLFTNVDYIKELKNIKNQDFVKNEEFLDKEDLYFLRDIQDKYFKKKFFNQIFRKIFSKKFCVKVLYKCDICGKEEIRNILSYKELNNFIYEQPDEWWLCEYIPVNDVNDYIKYEFDYCIPKKWERYNNKLFCQSCLIKEELKEIEELRYKLLNKFNSLEWDLFYDNDEKEKLENKLKEIYKKYNNIELNEEWVEIIKTRIWYENHYDKQEYIEDTPNIVQIRNEIKKYENDLYNTDIKKREYLLNVELNKIIKEINKSQ